MHKKAYKEIEKACVCKDNNQLKQKKQEMMNKTKPYRNAARYSASPIIAPVNATLTVNPRPRSMPHSAGAPVPGKKLPSSYRCREM